MLLKTKKFILDTNCILSYITDRNTEQQKKISPYFEQATNSEIELLLVNQINWELIYALDKIYNINKKTIKNLSSSLGIISETIPLGKSELELWPDIIKDYVDSILAQLAHFKRIQLLTFDINISKQLQSQNIKHIRL